jgi:hypothetical protein
MKNFLAMMSLAIFLSACGSGDDGLPSSTTGTDVYGTSVTYVGPDASTLPSLPEGPVSGGGCASGVLVNGKCAGVPAHSTCKIPDVAMHLPASLLPSPMKYFVSTSNVLYCGPSNVTGIDFTQGPLKGLTCQELAADVPDALQQLPKTPLCVDIGGFVIPSCVGCVMVTRLDSGYFKGDSVVAGSSVEGALCSIAGEFMGWVC